MMLLATPCRTGLAANPDPEQFYRDKIEPVLRAECYRCHSSSAKNLKAGLHLDSRAGLLHGGDTGAAIVPGKSGESLLIHAIRHEDGLAMPPKKAPLPAAVVADFVKWVDMGVPGLPAEAATQAATTTFDEARKHWAFKPIRKAAPPPTRDPAWLRNPVDAFILAKLEERGWRPAPEASRSEWIRRVTFDLTGLPPRPEEITDFLGDRSVDAYERVVERLLDSPHYGERWAQHWLDVVRYAETEGYEYDREVPGAWRYRDYVIASLNRDKPFDRFVVEQIAGDEIGPNDPECLTASAFHRLGPVRRNAGNPEIALSRNEVLTERTDIIGAAFLGLTVGCARCHNHKLEPISQKDYYRLQAYMAATDEHNIILAASHDRVAWEKAIAVHKDALARLKERAKQAAGAEKARLIAEMEDLEDKEPESPPTIPGTANAFPKRTVIHVLKRGEWENPGEAVGPRPLSVLVSENEPELTADVTDPRTRLARWLVSPGHPLTARVIANRLWQHHFGAGLVKTVNDFGTKGDRPSHPELLDWLASALVDNGWRWKPIHRLLVLSNTYRQSTRPVRSAEAAEKDPEDRLLCHFRRRRLEAEEIRDAMLAASGRLNLKAGGPSVMVPVDPDLVKLLYKPSQWKLAGSASEYDRRSIYLTAKRNLRIPFMETFDAPPLLTSCARRESSTHAPQALEMLNGRLSGDLARAFAHRLTVDTGGVPEKVVDRAFRLALGRAPTPDELRLSLAFLRDQPLEEFALAIFNLNEFFYGS
jgi:hypothetical protein